MDNKNLSKYRIAGTQHPCWNWKGRKIDLRKIDDKEAERLHKEKFQFVEPVEATSAAKTDVKKSGKN